MLSYTATIETRGMIEGLSYWISDIEYIKERFGVDDPELSISRKTVESLFDKLDKAGVPFWVQNSVIAFASDWRRTKAVGIWEALKPLGICWGAT